MNQTNNKADTTTSNAQPSLVQKSVGSWQLAKVPLCGLIGGSTLFGGVVFDSTITPVHLLTAVGVTMVAMAGATFNSLQERKIDGHLTRTAQRPLVRGVVSCRFAVLQALLLLMAGLIVIWLQSVKPISSVMFTLAALGMYNGVYTRMKQKTALALAVGAVCGSLPPIIGYLSSGGDLFSYPALLLFTLLFLWQVPHFCLILLIHRNDYAAVSQPTLLKSFYEGGVRRLCMVWVVALAVVMMIFARTPVVTTTTFTLAVFLNAFILALYICYQLCFHHLPQYKRLFLSLNFMLANHMAIILVAALV